MLVVGGIALCWGVFSFVGNMSFSDVVVEFEMAFLAFSRLVDVVVAATGAIVVGDDEDVRGHRYFTAIRRPSAAALMMSTARIPRYRNSVLLKNRASALL